ncbi:MAG: hypothetical protein RL226_1877 [Bacteroidota bacterium]|jgi:hypothetical protein
MKKLFLYTALVTILAACEKEIPFEGDFAEQDVVLNCYLGAGEPVVYAQVSRSETVISSEPFEFVTNATLVLYKNGTSVGTFSHVGEGRYELQHEPVAGAIYRIVCTDPVLGTVEASTYVPNFVGMGIYNNVPPPFEGDFQTFDIRFQDAATNDNFYHLLFYAFGFDFSSILTFQTKTEFLRSGNAEFGEEYANFWDDCLFADDAFNGQEGEIDIRLVTGPGMEIRAQLVHVSEDYFNFVKSLKLYNEASGNPFSQPVQIYSNIEGGLGIFAGYATAEVLVP